MKQYPVSSVDLASGETLAYRSAGSPESPALLLIHGNMTSSVHWQTTMEAFEDQFRIFAPDLRGFGDSSYLATFDSLGELARDVAEFCDLVGLGEFSVVGWSTGGGVALELAAERPEQVKQVVLLDSVPLTGYPMFKKDGNGQPILDQPLTSKEEIAADPVQVLPALNAYASGNREVMRGIWNAAIYNLHQPPGEDYELYLDAIMKQRNLVDVDYSLLTFNMTDPPAGSGRARLVKCPVVVLQGGKDLVVPQPWGKSIADFFGSRCEYLEFPEAGHSVITDDPPLFFSTLDQLLER